MAPGVCDSSTSVAPLTHGGLHLAAAEQNSLQVDLAAVDPHSRMLSREVADLSREGTVSVPVIYYSFQSGPVPSAG